MAHIGIEAQSEKSSDSPLAFISASLGGMKIPEGTYQPCIEGIIYADPYVRVFLENLPDFYPAAVKG